MKKCKVCGAKLNKEGDICKECYKKQKEREKLEKDTNQLLKFKRKYIPGYEVVRRLDLIVVFLLVAFVYIANKQFMAGLGIILVLFAIMLVILFFNKKIAQGTKVIFYETKLKYNFDFWIIHNEKIVKYSDITDINYYQTYRQRKFDLADFGVYVKHSGIFGGFYFKCLPNAGENLEKIKETVFKPE